MEEKTREFINNHLRPIIELEHEGVDLSVLDNAPNLPYWQQLLKNEVNILEIGFGAGFFAVYALLSNPNTKITCIDEGYHRYSYACYEKIREIFGEHRIQFYLGNSNFVLPILKEKYDLIYYDGSGAPEVIEKDFIYSFPLFHENTITVLAFHKHHLTELWEKYCRIFQLEIMEGIEEGFFRRRNVNIKNEIETKINQIPKKIHRIWQTEISERMQIFSDRLQQENPEFEYILYTAETAREFIRDHFDTVVLHAFDSLVPFSFKADLFRYCVMYIHGGIYLDMKFESVNGFRFTEVLEKEQYVLDVDGNSIYNALLICKPRSKVMFKCIFQIVKHVKDKDYTDCDLSITGPGMAKHMVTKELKAESRLKHECINYNKYILKDGIPILKNYHRYYEDTPKCGQKNYLDYWRNREIYLDIDLSSYQT
jgi:hypothetical protein